MTERPNNNIILIISTFFVFLNFGTTMAQFPEDFNNCSEPPLLPGWQVFSGLNGLGTNEQWQLVPTIDTNNNTCSEYMRVGYEDVIGGLSQDWLLTPQFTITSIDSSGISFAQKQEYEIDYGSTFKVFVTTDATADLNSSWTLIDSWGESDFTMDWTRRYIELSAYLNIPIYLAFVLEQDNGDSWLIDDVRRHGVCQGQKYEINRLSFYSAIPKDQFPGIDLNLNFTGFLDMATTYSVKLAIERMADFVAGNIPLSAIPHMDTLIVEDPPFINDFEESYDQSIAFSDFAFLIPDEYTFFIYDSGGTYLIEPNGLGTSVLIPTPPGYMHNDLVCTNYCTGVSSGSNVQETYVEGNCGTRLFFNVTDNLYRRFELSSNSFPINPNGNTNPIIVGNTYEVTTAAFLDSVEFWTIPTLSAVGESVRIVISNVTNGLPSNTIIGQSDYYTYSVNEATGTPQQFVVPTADLNGSPLWLQPGTYFIGFEKLASTSSYGLLASESPNATGTAFYNINGSAFAPLDQVPALTGKSPYIGAFLNICSTNTVFENVSECDIYTWNTNGQTYTQSGQYSEVLTNQSGCDSTVTLDLTINSSSSSTQTQTAIDSYTWPVNNETYTESGTYTAVIPNAVGCDSTITLDLTLEFTGLDENESSYVAVYPNPTFNSFTLSTKDMINMNYTLVDIQGKVVLTGKIESPEETVDISNLSKGQYNLVFEDENISPISIIKN